MSDFRILENLFEKHDDQIHFNLFKESNIIGKQTFYFNIVFNKNKRNNKIVQRY